MLRYTLYPISDKIKKTVLNSIYRSMDKYTNLNTVVELDARVIDKYSFFPSLLVSFLAGYYLRFMVESKNIS